MDPLDPRVADYVRSRADHKAPDGLVQAAIARVKDGDVATGNRFGWRPLLGAAAAAVVLLAAVFVLSQVLRPSTTGLASSPDPQTYGPAPTPTEAVGNGRPAFVEGMPVQSVASAEQLLKDGQLDGKAVAVAGYYFEFHPSCPGPSGYEGPLDYFCRIVAFEDSAEAAQVCSFTPNSITCGAGVGQNNGLSPEFMSETSGADARRLGRERDPVGIVLVGHAADPRLWQCRDTTNSACRKAFVVDRVAWVDGRDVALADPDTYDPITQNVLHHRLPVQDVEDAVGADRVVVSAAPFRASDIASIDPRFNFAGDDVVWVVRSFAAGDQRGSNPIRPLDIALVDDATGRVLDSRALVERGFEPARIWLRGTTTEQDGQGNPPQNEVPLIQVRQQGTELFDSYPAGSQRGGSGLTTYGPGSPLVVEPGQFEISARWGRYDGETVEADRTCSTETELRAGEDAFLSADFGKSRPCEFHSFDEGGLDYY